jgi:hypothetical protein
MAVKRIIRHANLTAAAEKLVETIKEEMRRPEIVPASEGAPLVLSEDDEGSGYVNYYVIWDDFKSIDHETRTRIVLNAVQAERPEDYSRISIALGLTKNQAETMGIEFIAAMCSAI